jgi:phospholipid N-methyltransferase
MTSEILKRLSDPKQYTGIELNADLVAFLQKQYQGAHFIQGSAELCHSIAQKEGLFDAAISSLPWTVFPPDLQERLLASIAASLKNRGQFVTYVCLNASLYPSAKNLKQLLEKNFRTIQKTRTEWRNIPPAFVYSCTK